MLSLLRIVPFCLLYLAMASGSANTSSTESPPRPAHAFGVWRSRRIAETMSDLRAVPAQPADDCVEFLQKAETTSTQAACLDDLMIAIPKACTDCAAVHCGLQMACEKYVAFIREEDPDGASTLIEAFEAIDFMHKSCPC
ncbi:unnamed protein product [Symbiodinium sp. CCMP2592]|nr:unnamed protein product [Symbiodinium sp. CCMP2592]